MLEVIGQDEVTAGHEGAGTACPQPHQHGAGAGPEADRVVVSSPLGDAMGVVHYGLLDRDLPGGVHQRQELFAIDHRGKVHQHILGVTPKEQLHLLLLGGIGELDANQEAVQRRLGDRVGSMELDRVARGENGERLAEGHGASFDRDLALLHRLQQTGQCPGAGAVDLVSQHHVGEQRTLHKLELLVRRLPHSRANDVRWHQVVGELDAVEVAAQAAGDGASEQRLANAGDAFDQRVAASQQGNEQCLHGVVTDRHYVSDPLVDGAQKRRCLVTLSCRGTQLCSPLLLQM